MPTRSGGRRCGVDLWHICLVMGCRGLLCSGGCFWSILTRLGCWLLHHLSVDAYDKSFVGTLVNLIYARKGWVNDRRFRGCRRMWVRDFKFWRTYDDRKQEWPEPLAFERTCLIGRLKKPPRLLMTSFILRSTDSPRRRMVVPWVVVADGNGVPLWITARMPGNASGS